MRTFSTESDVSAMERSGRFGVSACVTTLLLLFIALYALFFIFLYHLLTSTWMGFFIRAVFL